MKFIVKDITATFVDPAPRFSFGSAATPEEACQFYREIVETEPSYEREKEHVVVVTLNTHLRPTGWNLVSLGGLDEASCHPREVFRPVIVRAAFAFVLLHNHPSGDPSPSRADAAITKRLVDAADLLRIRMLDHIIVGAPTTGRKSYYSFREGGLV